MKNQIKIFMDDSGKFNSNEDYFVYAGLFFYNDKDYIEFINKYKMIVKDIKLKVYNNYISRVSKQSSNNLKSFNDFELKGTTLKYIPKSEKRRIFQLLKKQNIFALIIENFKVSNILIENKGFKGRYLDYTQKNIILDIIEKLISNNKIDINSNCSISIGLDQENKPNNGYYTLKEILYEELKLGINNFNYSRFRNSKFKKNLNLKVTEYISNYNFGIQASDLIAYTIKKEFNNNSIDNIFKNLKVFKVFPE